MNILEILSLVVSQAISPLTAGYVLCAIGLSLHFGYTGLLNFGQAAFAALGAYGLAYAVLNWGFEWWQAAIFGLICSVIFAFLLGIPTLRLRADYLAIVTIAAANAFAMAAGSSSMADITGGSAGLSQFGEGFYAINPIPEGDYGIGAVALTNSEIWIRIVGWLLVAVATVFVAVLVKSPWGRVLRGIREDEDAVRALGKNVFAFKMQSLVIGGAIASIGGMVFVMSSQTNQPSIWVSDFTFMTWSVLLLGGAATVFGPAVGAIAFFSGLVLTESVLASLVQSGLLPFLGIEQVGQIRFLLVGLVLMLLVIFRPQGFFGNKKELQFNG